MADTTTKKNTTKADLEAKNAELEAKLAEMAEMLAALQTSTKKDIQAAEPVYQAQPQYTTVSSDVTLVYCSDSLGYAKISNMEFHFNRYGEEFVMTRSQFDELVGKYRSWFDRGILAVSYKNLDVAVAKGVRTDKEFALKHEVLDKLGKMSLAQIEELWNDTKEFSHKQSIVSFYKRNFIEDAPGYRDRGRVDLLNRLTDGGFQREQNELSGNFKYSQIDF